MGVSRLSQRKAWFVYRLDVITKTSLDKAPVYELRCTKAHDDRVIRCRKEADQRFAAIWKPRIGLFREASCPGGRWEDQPVAFCGQIGDLIRQLNVGSSS
jgi:hypothetical protein